MQDCVIPFSQIKDKCTPGITELFCETLGPCVFVGFSKQGDAVVQLGDNNITSIPEITWNIWELQKEFEPETHVRYLKTEDLALLNQELNVNHSINLASEHSMLYQYEATIHIRRIYDRESNNEQ